MEQMQGPITTATSQEEGRLKVGVGSSYNKKKKDSVKAIVKKYRKDGRGGPTNAPNSPLDYSNATNTDDLTTTLAPHSSYVPMPGSAPALSQSGKTTGFRMVKPLKLKGLNKLQASISGLNKKIKGRL